MTFDFHTSSLKNRRASTAEKTEAEGSMRFAKIPQIVYDEVRAGALVHNIYIYKCIFYIEAQLQPSIGNKPVLCTALHDVLALPMSL